MLTDVEKIKDDELSRFRAEVRDNGLMIGAMAEALDKAHELLSVVAGTVRDGVQRQPIGVHGELSGIARYLTHSFVMKCADWCENEYDPGERKNTKPSS